MAKEKKKKAPKAPEDPAAAQREEKAREHINELAKREELLADFWKRRRKFLDDCLKDGSW